MNKVYDVIISGAGPSGSLLGYLLACSGIQTLIIEKEIFPRLKICAGGIQHRTLDMLPFEIRPVIENIIFGIYFSYRNSDIFLRKNEKPIMYTVDRKKFDNFLATKARDAGCDINFGEKTIGYTVGKDGVEVITGKKLYSAKILVGADGVRGCVAGNLIKGKEINKILGYMVELPYKKDESIIEKNYKGPGDKYIIKDKKNNSFDMYDSVRLDFNGVKKGYGWVFPKKKFFSLGVGGPSSNAVSLKKYLGIFFNDFYLPDGESGGLKGIFGHGIPIRNKNTPVRDYRILTVGDAACLADGFTGEGLYNGFRSSIIASSAINRALGSSCYDFEDYEREIEDDIYTDIEYSIKITRIFYSSSLFFYKLIKKNDNYFYACCKLLRGEKNYKDVSKRLKSLILKR